jgi:hypothetical protein
MQLELAWPTTWTAFGPFSRETPVPSSELLAVIPDTLTIAGQTFQPVTITLENHGVDLAQALGLKTSSLLYGRSNFGEGKTVYLFAELNVPRTGQLLIGAGADWWMQWFLDGTCIYDTLNPNAQGHSGNATAEYSISNHIFTVDIKPGKHTLAVRVIGGNQGCYFCSSGGQVVIDTRENVLQWERDHALSMYQKEKTTVDDLMQIQQSKDFISVDKAFQAPSFETLSSSPLSVRLLASMSSPSLIHYAIHQQADRLIHAVKKHRVGDAWTPTGDFNCYIQTGQPLTITYKHEEILKHEIDANDPELSHLVRHLEKEYQGKFFSFQVGEWSNYFIWDLRVFNTTADEISHIDRKTMYHRVLDTFRRWKKTVNGHLHSVNGFCLITHIGAEAGEDLVGIETGENIPCAQVARAFTRGAARQFGLAWTEQISQWYQNTVPSGRPIPMMDMTPGSVHPTLVGEHTGHSVSLLTRLWFSAWFSGAAAVNIEAASGYLFDVAYNDKEFPEEVNLSEYGKWAQQLNDLMKAQDIGIPYAPFAVLVSKYHGRMATWRNSWRLFEETLGDVMTVRFFDQIFPGQSMGSGYEQRYLCPSPYGDTFDVFINDAEQSALRAYPVIFAVGDIEWTGQDVDFLQEYVRDGGILCLNEINLNGWDRKFLGLAYDRFLPTAEAQTVLAGFDNSARLIRRNVGKGTVFTSALKPEPAIDSELMVPNALLQALTEKFIPFHVEGKVETLFNRTAIGWAVMIINNQGFHKTRLDPPVIDPMQTQSIHIAWTQGRYQVNELIANRNLVMENQSLRFQLPPGEIALLIFKSF